MKTKSEKKGRIAKERDVKRVKALGRKVTPFDEAKWIENREEVSQ